MHGPALVYRVRLRDGNSVTVVAHCPDDALHEVATFKPEANLDGATPHVIAPRCALAFAFEDPYSVDALLAPTYGLAAELREGFTLHPDGETVAGTAELWAEAFTDDAPRVLSSSFTS